MKLRLIAAAAALSFACAGAAMAAEVSATLQAPVNGRSTVISGGGLFICVANTCNATDAPSRTQTVAGCKELVKAVGPVAAYGVASKPLDAESLTRCNASARPASR